MADSLRDQLKKSGLVSKKKAKQIEQERRPKNREQQRANQQAAEQNKRNMQKERADKIARDKQLNLQKTDKAERKAIAAQIKQLIETNKILSEGEQEFKFTEGKTIKRILVSSKQVNQLSKGIIVIVKQGDQYIIVPAVVADRIEERDTSRIIFRAEKAMDIDDADDPYADYKIPDDLMW
ncbi:MAG: DUF2058 domain-containing protein [Pseudomonadales bacterium]|nr:DUF2058 domain-containing protein [Pseudomonadales bacterium]